MAVIQELGDELRGDRVLIIAREIDKPFLSSKHRSGTHKRMQTTARNEVRCVLEQPYRFVLQKKQR